MELTNSVFAEKIVEQSLENIQKALVISHGYYVSKGRYSEALKITSLLARFQDDDGCFNFEEKNHVISKEMVKQNITNEDHCDNLIDSLGQEQLLNEDLDSFFLRIGKSNLEKRSQEKL